MMAIIGTFEPYRDVNSSLVARVFAKYARSEHDLARAKKGKSAQFESQNLSIADIASKLSKVGRVRITN